MANEEIGSRFEIPFTYADFPDDVVDDEDDVVYEVVATATTGAISMMAVFFVNVGGELAASRGRLRDGDATVGMELRGEEVVGATASERIDEVA